MLKIKIFVSDKSTRKLIFIYQSYFLCTRWNQKRNELEAVAGKMTSDNIIGFMDKYKNNFKKVNNFVTKSRNTMKNYNYQHL